MLLALVVQGGRSVYRYILYDLGTYMYLRNEKTINLNTMNNPLNNEKTYTRVD